MAATVLAVAQASELGGAEYGLLRVARHLPRHGLEVELTVPGPGPLADRARALGLTVHDFLPVGGLQAGGWARAIASWPKARALGADPRIAAVWLNGTVAQRLAPGFLGVPLVPHVHDLLETAPRPWRFRRFWGHAPIVMCDSHAVAAVATELGAPSDRIRVVHCPVDPVTPAERPGWAEEGRPVVGYVGRIEPRKGTLDLLRAVPVLAELRPDARVVVVGADELGASADYARRTLAAAHELGDRVTVTGTVPDAASLMPWFDVLCVPSHVEPFGTVAAEALAAGTPVVATRSGGMEEYVVPDRNGALVEPGDPRGLAVAIAHVLERSEELGRNGAEDAARFASERVAASVAEALHEAIAAWSR